MGGGWADADYVCNLCSGNGNLGRPSIRIEGVVAVAAWAMLCEEIMRANFIKYSHTPKMPIEQSRALQK